MNSLLSRLPEGVIEKSRSILTALGGNVAVALLSAMGAMSTLSLVLKGLYTANCYLLGSPSKLKKLYGGSWAIVTGGSSGIGLEFARDLVTNDVNVIIIARNQQKLNDAACLLQSCNPKAQIKTVSLDANSPNYDALIELLTGNGIDNVSLLINNVGVHNSIPAEITEISRETTRRIINVNCSFQVELASLIIPYMKNRKPGQQATIVNVSSLTSKMAMPMLSVYAATKAFEEHWSFCLGGELQPYGIEVLCVRPGLTVSEMSGVSEPSFFVPSASVMAKACLSFINSGYDSVVPYWPHAILDAVNKLAPRDLVWSSVRTIHLAKRKLLLAQMKS